MGDQHQSDELGAHLAKYVGKHVHLSQSRRNGADIEVDGTIDRAERVLGMTIRTDEGSFLACRFRVKPDDGSRAIWTHALADREYPVRGQG